METALAPPPTTSTSGGGIETTEALIAKAQAAVALAAEDEVIFLDLVFFTATFLTVGSPEGLGAVALALGGGPSLGGFFNFPLLFRSTFPIGIGYVK